MKRIWLVPSLVVVAVLAGLGLVLAWPRPPLDSALTSPAAPPTRLVCYGYVDCRQGPVLLQATQAGRVIQIFAKEGQTVSKDTQLMQLDDHLIKLYEEEAELAVQAGQVQLTKAQSGLKQYQAKRAQATAAVEAAQVKWRAAQHYLTVREGVLKDGFDNPGQLDLARDQVDDAKALVTIEQHKLAELNAVDPELEVKLAELELKRSQAQLRRARQQREEMVLKTPVAGTVLRLGVQEGDLVGPTSPRPAVWLAPVGALVVRAEVSQEFAGRVRVGLAVQVEDDASGAALAWGTIAEVADYFLPRRQLSAEPTAVNTGLVLECLTALDEGHAPLRLGQRVRVRILANSASG